MVQFSNLTIRAAVVNQNEAMETDTISKNGRSSKSHTSRGNFRLILCISLLSVVLFSSCSYRIVDFTIISSKNHTIRFDMTQGKRVEGKSMGFLGIGTSLKDAMDKALESAGQGYDLLVDGVVQRVDNFFVVGFKVTGTAVRSTEMRASLGEEEFQKWLKDNNVFDPETAVVQK